MILLTEQMESDEDLAAKFAIELVAERNAIIDTLPE
jgi:hypothetical protein